MENPKNDAMKEIRKKAGGKKKIWLIILLIVLLLWVLGAVMRNNAQKKMEEMQSQMALTQTEEVSRRSLTKSVGATGKIVSVEKEEMSVNLTGIDVAEVFVEVGDVVEEGTKLVSFDTADIEESLSEATAALNRAQSQNNISADNAARNVADAQRNEAYQISSAQTAVDNAYRTYEDALNAAIDANAVLDTLKSAETLAQTAMEECRVNAENNAESVELQQAYQQSVTKYNEAKAARETQESTLALLSEQAVAAQNAYNTQVKSYDNTVASQASSVASAVNSQTSAALNMDTTTQENQVELYQKQLESGTLYAPFSGTVTAVNYDAGDTYSGGAIITIQDCSSYRVEVEIGEYDISDIAVGQKVLIKTDATGDDEMEGVVTFVSPVATTSAAASVSGVSSSEVTYTVRIDITNPSDRLRLDMTASLSIIIEQHEDVLTVPYNAVQTDENGESFVTVVDETGETEDVFVDTVMESNYYTEIQSDVLEEGMQVMVIESQDNGMFNFMPGGRGGF